MSDVYYSPGKYGLTTIGEIDWSDGCYQFDLTVVWKREADGRFLYADNSGCSCPSPFEDMGIDELTLLPEQGSLVEFQAHCAEIQAGEDRSSETAELLERMHAAGAR